MKWIFSKENEQCKIILQKTDGTKMDFSYINMIKELYEEKKIDEAEFEGDFSEGEKESVKALIDEINNHTRDFFGQENETSGEM